MKRNLLYLIALATACMLGYALHLQYFYSVKACQLCVLQRYALALLAIVCFVCAFFNAPRTGAGCGLVLALCGGGTAGWQVWHTKKASLSCSVSSLETMLNHLITAKYFPALFRVETACVDDKFRLLSLSIPQWSLIAFGAFAVVFLFIFFVRGR